VVEDRSQRDVDGRVKCAEVNNMTTEIQTDHRLCHFRERE